MTNIPENGFVLLPAEEIDSASREQVHVTVRLVGRDSAGVGRLLDLIECAAMLGSVGCEIEAPGYFQSFYGWEKRL
jgi:hypothetical protein